MKKLLPTKKQVLKFAEEERQDWILLREASDNGDEDATLALALFRCLNHELDEIKTDLENPSIKNDPKICNIRLERMAGLLLQRRSILYEDYKIQDKRGKIYIDLIERQRRDRGRDHISIN